MSEEIMISCHLDYKSWDDVWKSFKDGQLKFSGEGISFIFSEGTFQKKQRTVRLMTFPSYNLIGPVYKEKKHVCLGLNNPVELDENVTTKRLRLKAKDSQKLLSNLNLYIENFQNVQLDKGKKHREQKLHHAERLELAGRYEEAAGLYESLGMHEKAGEVRRMERTQYVISTSIKIGKNGGIDIGCPHCGASQPAESKTSEVTCKYCGRKYIVPKRILDMI